MLGPPFIRMLAKIDHHEPTLIQTVVVIDANGARRQLKWEFVTSGEDSVNGVGAGQMRTRASWEGEELLIESWLAVGEHTSHFRDYRLLSNSGETMTMEHRNDDLAGQIAVLERAPNADKEFFSHQLCGDSSLRMSLENLTWPPLASQSQNLFRKTCEKLGMGCEFRLRSRRAARPERKYLKRLEFCRSAARVSNLAGRQGVFSRS
jgi:hypothetical protein